jgi:hypothetical protein
MEEPKLVIRGIEITPDEIAELGIRIVGEVSNDGSIPIQQVRKALGAMATVEPISTEITDLARKFQQLYRELKLKREHEKEFVDKIVGEIIRKQAEISTQTDMPDHEKSKRRGRLKLSKDEISFRRQKVKEAEGMRKKDPQRPWKDIARELGIPERTLRDWRHNNY